MIQSDNSKDQFLVKADHFAVDPLKYFNDQISNTALEKAVNRHDDHIDAYAGPALKADSNGYLSGIGIGIPIQTYQVLAKQTFIVHNGEVYIRAAAIKDATIKHATIKHS